MFVVSNFLTALANILSLVLTVCYWLIIFRAIISWVKPDPYNVIVQFLYKTTEPFLALIRKVLPSNFRFGIDISPLVALIIIFFLERFLIKTLFDIAQRLR